MIRLTAGSIGGSPSQFPSWASFTAALAEQQRDARLDAAREDRGNRSASHPAGPVIASRAIAAAISRAPAASVSALRCSAIAAAAKAFRGCTGTGTRK